MNDTLKEKINKIVENHNGSNLELMEKLKDIAREHNTTLLHVIGYVEECLAIEGKGGLSFKSNKDISEDYVERRLKGE